MLFVHNGDGQFMIDGLPITAAEWTIFEPQYSLPVGFIGRIFKDGEYHHLINTQNIASTPADANDPIILAYLGKKAAYAAAQTALQNGQTVVNVNGQIVIRNKPTLASVDGKVLADGVDTEIVTCTVSDNTYTGQITWKVTDPHGVTLSETESMVAGAATLNLKVAANDAGNHRVTAQVVNFGSVEINVEAY